MTVEQAIIRLELLRNYFKPISIITDEIDEIIALLQEEFSKEDKNEQD